MVYWQISLRGFTTVNLMIRTISLKNTLYMCIFSKECGDYTYLKMKIPILRDPFQMGKWTHWLSSLPGPELLSTCRDGVKTFGMGEMISSFATDRFTCPLTCSSCWSAPVTPAGTTWVFQSPPYVQRVPMEFSLRRETMMIFRFTSWGWRPIVSIRSALPVHLPEEGI